MQFSSTTRRYDDNPSTRSRLSLAARALLVAQRIYKVTLSPLIGQQCRYLPTCSDYAAGCVAAHGAWRGSWMGLARVCRCRPGGGAGYDPVPLTCSPVPAWMPWRYGDWQGGVRPAPDVPADAQMSEPNSVSTTKDQQRQGHDPASIS
ncbi:putative membrane protein insertion efficiency factor [Candidatus Phycosocius bacilliformis]|uniref:Putative membrane protein insertion efficiency factor n=1 Tax=Candidatus Phycosocius bacilliformis TaxID=1445552 RepID=A0A2P2E6S8_9PROT|nr:putative membrane protein insertion efficiency factor [Candidatus Phycosocius bacilliformis]